MLRGYLTFSCFAGLREIPRLPRLRREYYRWVLVVLQQVSGFVLFSSVNDAHARSPFITSIVLTSEVLPRLIQVFLLRELPKLRLIYTLDTKLEHVEGANTEARELKKKAEIC